MLQEISVLPGRIRLKELRAYKNGQTGKWVYPVNSSRSEASFELYSYKHHNIYILYFFSADSTVCLIRLIIVIGPTPPGTGV